MEISNSKSIEDAINKAQKEAKELELEERSEKLAAFLHQKYLSRPIENRWPCAALLLSFVGDNAHLAVDEIDEMKSTFIDLLVFLTNPEIAQKFEEIRELKYADFAIHLRRAISLLNGSGAKEIMAEMAHFDLCSSGPGEQYLEGLESDFYGEKGE